MRRISRTTAVGAAVGIQAMLLVTAVAPRLSARLFGDIYLVRVAPIDPIDPFRGAYVRLGYPDISPAEFRSDVSGTVFVPLVRDGDLWRGDGLLKRRPGDGPYLTCDYDGQLRCGIESLFAAQDDARALERDLADGAVARLKVDDRGHAIVLGIARR